MAFAGNKIIPDDEVDAAADDGDLWNYYSDDELENDDKLRDEEEDAYKLLTLLF